jgi:hypothetical protein
MKIGSLRTRSCRLRRGNRKRPRKKKRRKKRKRRRRQQSKRRRLVKTSKDGVKAVRMRMRT